MPKWPDPKLSQFAPSTMKSAWQKRRERERRIRSENSSAGALTAGRTIDGSALKRSAANFALLAKIHDELRSPKFAAWFEATTGEAPDEWLKRVVISPEQWMHLSHSAGLSQLEWTKEQIQFVADRNPWTDPEKKAYWGDYLASCDDAVARRIMLIKLATPRWADPQKMADVYLERDRLTSETGVLHHVDHIVPIVHPLVCGLNWEGNLRVIPAADNMRKSNKFHTDMSA